MARPKAEDPKVAITVRVRRSALDVWERRATNKGVPVRQLIADRIEAATSVPASPPRRGPDPGHVGPAVTGPTLARSEVEPSFKGGKK